MTSEERRQRLIALGYDPDQYEYVTAEEKALEETGPWSAAWTGAKQSVGPVLGGVAGTIKGAKIGAAAGPWGTLAGAIIGGLGAAWAGGQAQTAIEDAALDDAGEQALDLQRWAAHTKHPWATFGGQLAASGPFFRPSPTTLRHLPGWFKNRPLRTETAMQRHAFNNVVLGGAVEGGVDLGVQAMGDDPIDWSRVGGAALTGGLLTQPTRAYGRVGSLLDRSGMKGKEWLDAQGYSRPLTEEEAAAAGREASIEHQKAVTRLEEESSKALIERVTEHDSRKLVADIKEPTLAELQDAEKAAQEHIEVTETALKDAQAKAQKIEEQLTKAVQENLAVGYIRSQQAQLKKAQEVTVRAEEAHTTAREDRIKLTQQITELKEKAAKAWADAEERDERWGGEPRPAPDDLFEQVQGLMHKQGMTMMEAVADLRGRVRQPDGSSKSIKLRGEYDPKRHAVTLDKDRARADTPWHEYLHGLLSVLRQRGAAKHRALVDFIDNNLFKGDEAFEKLSSDEKQRIREEAVVERGGKLLAERMTNPPKGFLAGLQKWFTDWRLERNVTKGRTSSDIDEHLERLAEWLAMRGERQPALQPKEGEALLKARVGSNPYAPVHGILAGGARYSEDVQQPSELPDSPQTRVAAVIRRSLAATSNPSISKAHIEQELKTAEKAGALGPEDRKWSQKMLDVLDRMPTKKIPRDVVESVITAYDYRVEVREFSATPSNLAASTEVSTQSNNHLLYFSIEDRQGVYSDSVTFVSTDTVLRDAASTLTKSLVDIFDVDQKISIYRQLADDLTKELGVETERRLTVSEISNLLASLKDSPAIKKFIGDHSPGVSVTVIYSHLAYNIGRPIDLRTGRFSESALYSEDFLVWDDRAYRTETEAKNTFFNRYLNDRIDRDLHENTVGLRGENYKVRTLVHDHAAHGETIFEDPEHSSIGAETDAIGWTRTNDLVDIDGTHTKHIIELQSPYHQDPSADHTQTPYGDKRYIDLLVRDALLNAVKDGQHAVSWPMTTYEIHATQGYDQTDFIRHRDNNLQTPVEGRPSANYDNYLVGEHTVGRHQHTFKGGSGGRSRIRAAFEKLIKDYQKHLPAETPLRVRRTDIVGEVNADDTFDNVNPLDIDDWTDYHNQPANAMGHTDFHADGTHYRAVPVEVFDIMPDLREFILQEGRIESPRQQALDAEVLEAAALTALKHKPASGDYSSRVWEGVKTRVLKGATPAQLQAGLREFIGDWLPEKFTGEELAQITNAVPHYHGTTAEAREAIMQGGFDPQHFQDGAYGVGVYMTTNADHAKNAYARDSEPIKMQTKFKRLLILDRDHYEHGFGDFMRKFDKQAKELGLDQWQPYVDSLVNDTRSGTPETNQVIYNTLFRMVEGGSANVHKVLHAMGYDGLSALNATNDRTTVMFREHVDEADQRLTEYTSQRVLQREDAADFLKDVAEYQATSVTDHFASNPLVKRPWILDSVVTLITQRGETADERRTSRYVGQRFAAADRDAKILEGEFLEGFALEERGNVRLTRQDAEYVMTYLVLERRRVLKERHGLDHDVPEIPAEVLARYNEPDSPVKHYVEYFRRQYMKARDLQIEAGIPIFHPRTGELVEAGKYEEYVPEIIRQEKWRELSGDEGVTKREAAMKELRDYWMRVRNQDTTHPNYITDAEIDSAVDAYVARLQGGNSLSTGSAKFSALRKAEGLGLPLSTDEGGHLAWIENDAANAYNRYMKRFARDLALFRHIEGDLQSRQILGIANPRTGQHEPAWVKTKNPFHVETEQGVIADRSVRVNKGPTTDPLIADYMRHYLGYYEGVDLFGRTANRFVVSHWLGVMSGTRDLLSSYVFSLPYMRTVDLPTILTSMAAFKDSWRRSHLMGVNAHHVNRIDHNVETHNKLADFFNRASDWASLLGGRTLLERSTRALQFGLGRALVLNWSGLKKGSSVTADRTLRQLAEMSGIDVELLRRHADKADEFNFPSDEKDGMTYDQVLDRMAAAWVDINQGTYSVRGVPSWTMSGPLSLFTSLSRWNIEKYTRMRDDIIGPLKDEGDWRPLIKATLGAAFTGALLIELSEYINNKFRANPTLMEAVNAGDVDEMGYAAADALNYAGYFGIASALFNDTIVNMSRGQRPSGVLVFPAWDFLSQSLSEPIFDAVEAVNEGADSFTTITEALKDVLKNTAQTYRILWNHGMFDLLGEDARRELEEKNIRRDLRIFRRFEGVRGVAPVAALGNPYLRPDTQDFKKSDTMEEAIRTLPAAVEEQRQRANGRGDKFKSYVEGLSVSADKTLPSVETVEGAQEFMRYKKHLTNLRGEMYWQRVFDQWVRNKGSIDPAKKALIRSYVANMMLTNQQ